MSESLEELSEKLIKLIKAQSYGLQYGKQTVESFLNSHENQSKEIVNTIGKVNKDTPLIAACKCLNLDIVKVLVEVGADVNMRNAYNESALYQLVRDHNLLNKPAPEIMRTLVENGADLNELQKDEKSAFFRVLSDMAVNKSLNYDLLGELINLGADVNTREGTYNQTPLLYISELFRDVEIMRFLIRNGADVNARDNLGRTPILHCVDGLGKKEAIDLLLDSGADVFLKDSSGKNAIDSLIFKWHYSTNFIGFLKSLRSYFEMSTPEKIRLDIDEFLRTRDDELFPISSILLDVMNGLIREFSCGSAYLNDPQFRETFLRRIDFVRYFIKPDFVEKLHADVINRISEENAEIDGQLLIGMRARAKCESEKAEIDQIIAKLNEKKQLAKDFYNAAQRLCECLSNFNQY